MNTTFVSWPIGAFLGLLYTFICSESLAGRWKWWW